MRRPRPGPSFAGSSKPPPARSGAARTGAGALRRVRPRDLSTRQCSRSSRLAVHDRYNPSRSTIIMTGTSHSTSATDPRRGGGDRARARFRRRPPSRRPRAPRPRRSTSRSVGRRSARDLSQPADPGPRAASRAAFANAGASPTGTSAPRRPSSTTVRKATSSLARTGVPAAIASARTIPNDSFPVCGRRRRRSMRTWRSCPRRSPCRGR